MTNPIEEHINYYQHFAPNPTAFRESLEGALVYAKNANKTLSMDLRDYFAAKAMVALTQKRHPYEILEEKYTKDIYKAAYAMADAMMKAREQ